MHVRACDCLCSRSNEALVGHRLAKDFDAEHVLQDLLCLTVQVGVHERLNSVRGWRLRDSASDEWARVSRSR